MRLIGVFSIATLIALALQTTFTRLLPFDVLMPNLALVLAVNLGLRYYSAAAALMAFGIGYATDTFSGGQLGLNALLFILVFIFNVRALPLIAVEHRRDRGNRRVWRGHFYRLGQRRRRGGLGAERKPGAGNAGDPHSGGDYRALRTRGFRGDGGGGAVGRIAATRLAGIGF